MVLWYQPCPKSRLKIKNWCFFFSPLRKLHLGLKNKADHRRAKIMCACRMKYPPADLNWLNLLF